MSNLLAVTTAAPPRAPPDTTPPTAPSNLHLVSRTTTSLNVGWTSSVDTESGIMMYLIIVSGTASSPTATPGVTLTGLVPFTQYGVGVVAMDNAGNQSSLVEATFRTPPSGPPTVMLTPASVTSGTSQSFTVAGGNIEPGLPVVIKVDGRRGDPRHGHGRFDGFLFGVLHCARGPDDSGDGSTRRPTAGDAPGRGVRAELQLWAGERNRPIHDQPLGGHGGRTTSA